MKDKTLQVQNLSRICNETLILEALREKDKHGYEISVELSQSSKGFFDLKHGTMYPILHRLEKEGFIKGVWSRNGNMKKKSYKITGKGKDLLKSYNNQWDNFFDQMKNFRS